MTWMSVLAKATTAKTQAEGVRHHSCVDYRLGWFHTGSRFSESQPITNLAML